MLGTESGCNIFDDYGEIQKYVNEKLTNNPSITYDEMYKNYLYKFEGKIKTNQISPKIFEAICLKTGMILYEGEYSGIIKPYINYIPLKKDKSNIEEVITLAKDNDYVQDMVDRTYDEIVNSQKYSYKHIIKSIDKDIIEC